LALNEALEQLERVSERQARIVEMRFFGGLANEEIAEAMDISLATVKRGWALAQAWLYREIAEAR
jgi:RNA polymerase sigma factor (sigma-70 family)